jgi:hypothetical protein
MRFVSRIHIACYFTATLSIACIACAISVFFVTRAEAQSSDAFTVQTIVGNDTTPPSIPSNVTAVPVAPTQIDLEWDPSTDDFLLSGYHIWRDDVRIATTTETTYSDTGLLASTTYRYYITAFDSFFNESASSTVVSTTTLSIPVVPEDDMRTTQSTRVVWRGELTELQVLPGEDSVTIRYTTKNPIRSVVQYGETVSYELGSVRKQLYTREHEVILTNLKSNQRYSFSISGDWGNGRFGTMHIGSFLTLAPDDVFPPGNVRNLRLQGQDTGVEITWENPQDIDFAGVRVVRSDQFYPTSPSDGWLVYEGSGARAFDEDGSQNDGWRYYSVFTYDEAGNVSSGAVSRVYRGESVPSATPTEPEIPRISISFSDLIFIQEGAVVPSMNGEVRLDGTKAITVSLPYERVPEHLKAIVIAIQGLGDTGEETQRFLLRVDADFTTYTTVIEPFGVSGSFPFVLTVYDFKTRETGFVEGRIVTDIAHEGRGDVHSAPPHVGHVQTIVFFLLLLLLIYMGTRLIRRS